MEIDEILSSLKENQTIINEDYLFFVYIILGIIVILIILIELYKKIKIFCFLLVEDAQLYHEPGILTREENANNHCRQKRVYK